MHSNDPTAEKVPIELVGKVTGLLAFDPQVVNLEMSFGEQRSQEVRLVGTAVDKAGIGLKKSALAEDSSVTLLSSQTGSTGGFRILCEGKKVGVHSGNLVVSTGLPSPKEIAMPYACKVAGTLEVSPTNPYFNLKLPGPKVVAIEVRSSQPDFAVRGVRVLEGPFAASIEGPLSDNSFRVRVKVIEEGVKQETRGTVGRIVVVSNDRTEPEKEIPLFGFGKLNAARAEEAPPAP